MARLGIVPGQPFDINKLNTAEVEASRPCRAGLYQNEACVKDSAKTGDSIAQNGWTLPLKTGQYGTDYIQRA